MFLVGAFFCGLVEAMIVFAAPRRIFAKGEIREAEAGVFAGEIVEGFEGGDAGADDEEEYFGSMMLVKDGRFVEVWGGYPVQAARSYVLPGLMSI